MVEKIAKLILERSFEGKLPDLYFVEDVVKIISDEYGLYFYIDDVNIVSTSGVPYSIKGEYDYAKKRVNIYLKSILQFYPETENINFFYLYTEVVEVIFHELEHARQYKIVYQGEESFEKTLIEMCTNVAIQSYKCQRKEILKDKLYFVFFYYKYPLERLARIDCTEKMIEITEYVDQYAQTLLIKDLEERLAKYYIDGYLFGISPAEQYMRFVNSQKWENQEFFDKDRRQLLNNVKEEFNLTERLRLGLPVSSREMKREIKNVKKYR